MEKLIIKEIDLLGGKYWSKKHQCCVAVIRALDNFLYLCLVYKDGQVFEDELPASDLSKSDLCK